jgi:hypothetical protein
MTVSLGVGILGRGHIDSVEKTLRRSFFVYLMVLVKNEKGDNGGQGGFESILYTARHGGSRRESPRWECGSMEKTLDETSLEIRPSGFPRWPYKGPLFASRIDGATSVNLNSV